MGNTCGACCTIRPFDPQVFLAKIIDMTSSNEAGAPPARPWARSRLLNIWVDDLTMGELMQRLDKGVVYTLNLDHCYQLQRNAEFLAAYRQADFITADSKYVWWSLGWIGRRVREKVSGSDIVPEFCRFHASNPDIKIFLLGSAPGVAQTARERMNARAGREQVIGAHGPSMKFVSDEEEIASVIQMINASGANVLIVGLGAPKQEVWIGRYRKLLPNVRIFMGVGATIDYEADAVARAPQWMASSGLEWLHRVLTDPKRYWRRYARDLEFFWLVLLDGFGLYRAPSLKAPNSKNST
jgi:N-acetylglucosaminyldiphosphoundecaprenol N-acetyl-beta-D-mannosaminyltransferase